MGGAIFIAGMGFVAYGFCTHLEALPLQNWDETRNAQNVQNILSTGDWWVIRKDGEPDFWNTKPPLLLWIQAALSMLLGPGLLALRLPSALFSFFLASWLPLVSFKRLGSVWPGWFAALLLVVANGFNGFHVSRTGDFDAPVIACMVWSAAQWWIWVCNPTDGSGNRYLKRFVLGMTLAFLFKGVVAFMFAPGMLIWMLMRSSSRKALGQKPVWIAAFSLLMVAFAYYLLRELAQPGYVAAVWDNEWFGRYGHAIEGHREGFWFYWDWLFVHGYFPLAIMIFPAILFIKFYTKENQRSFAFFVFLIAAQYFIIISWGETKLFWYAAPIIPLLCFVAALSWVSFWDVIQGKTFPSLPDSLPLLAIFAFWLVWQPLGQKTVQLALDPIRGYGLMHHDEILNNLRWYQGRKDCKTVFIPHYGYVEGAKWYNWVYERRGGPKLMIKSFSDAKAGEVWAIPRVWADSFSLRWHWQFNRYLPQGEEVLLLSPTDTLIP
jgi:4-amino-4-deoxy-L-arabinose transferase-like glycosyltransferase